ncbi:MAG: DUF3291 domain-containing protein [Acidimicrobiales bacterium]
MIHHLAQLNIAKFLQPIDHPDVADFVEMLEPINAMADDTPGFIWRLVGETDNATDIQFYDDPKKLVNMSVWTDIDSLRKFVYRSNHVEAFKRRAEWADAPVEAHQVLWWIPAWHQPSLDEADERLNQLRAKGPTASAFTFAKSFPSPNEPATEES